MKPGEEFFQLGPAYDIVFGRVQEYDFMTPQELEIVIRKVLAEGVNINFYVYLAVLLLSFLGSLVAIFIGSYLRKRGENYATKADFDTLLAQLRISTHATEEIKNQLSRGTWVDQKRWELKKEIYWDLLIALTMLDNALHLFRFASFNSDGTVRTIKTDKTDYSVIVGDHMKKLIAAHAVGQVILNEESLQALTETFLKIQEMFEGYPEKVLTSQLFQDVSATIFNCKDKISESAKKDLVLPPV